MGFIDRIRHDEEGTEKAKVHEFKAATHLLIRGKLTRGQYNTVLNITNDDKPQIDILTQMFTGKSEQERLRLLEDLDAVFILLETRKITKQQAKTILGL